MFIIAGLGNPENRYQATRHNTGFLAVDRLSERFGIEVTRVEGHALTGTGMIEGRRVMLCKPQTYMNSSGTAIQALTSYYRVDPETELLVIVDDIHLPVGLLRLRPSGSAGGHNGLKDIIQMLGSDRFARLRVGVGEAGPAGSLIPHVLGNFRREEWEVMDRVLEDAADAAILAITDGISAAMNRYNRKASAEDTGESD
ncbi:MAG: aminoacyl-tRNA hydrolase [Lachnospiraceae bacterium]|nr:aminoacyl-tRNA hydrolase [Lachnospiraceae bacterium]